MPANDYPPNYDRWTPDSAPAWQPPPPAEPKKPGRGKWIFAAVAALLLLVALCAGLFAAQGKPNNGHYIAPTAGVGDVVGQAGAHAANAVPTPAAKVPIGKSDIALTVKITKKDCYGSAGCNIDYQIVASLGKGVEYQECEVTYQVNGLEDAQIGTLKTHTDGQYEQDGYQSGETSSSSKKLTAKVTDVDCS